MRKNILSSYFSYWILGLVVGSLMGGLLVLAACAPLPATAPTTPAPTTPAPTLAPTTPARTTAPTTPTTAGTEMVKLSLKKADGTVVEKMVEKPKYGGMIVTTTETDPSGFGQGQAYRYQLWTMGFTHEEPVTGDWSRGPAGTNEYRFNSSEHNPLAYDRGALAESWELKDPTTFILRFRKGIRFHDKPPVNGREFVAADWVWSLKRAFGHPKSELYRTSTAWPIDSVELLDKYTVQIKIPKPNFESFRVAIQFVYAEPREFVDKYGEEAFYDWKNEAGTGPWTLQDYVRGSALTFKRFTGYWGRDPLHPENSVPYADTLKTLIIPDMSTRLAALRTGKIDILGGVSWLDAASLDRTNPELRKERKLSFSNILFAPKVGKTSQSDIVTQFSDIRVRRAASMAIDRRAIVDKFYGGNAEILTWPAVPSQPLEYVPLNELPPSARELYEYNPKKARELLAEAGYPNGFKITLLIYESAAMQSVDLASMVKAYWADVGIDLIIDLKEYGVWESLRRSHKFEMVLQAFGSQNFMIPMPALQTGQTYNRYGISDQYIDETVPKIRAIYDENERSSLVKKLDVYIIEQSFQTVTPMPYFFHYWWPWLANYDGETSMGYHEGPNALTYVWVDQELKKKMGR